MELSMSYDQFETLSFDEMYAIDGGGFWQVFSGVCTIIAGAASVVGGVVALLAPEPTGITKVCGWSAITGGVATIGAGIGTLCS